MTLLSNVCKTAIATVATLAVITAGATVAPTEANAGNNIACVLIGGAIIGGLIGIASQNRYAPVYRTYPTQWETRYSRYGRVHSVRVQHC
ncbi:MAG: hypothetical protein GY761_15605 [Hyphomicrobiales bacterium]|nr:hypothetical protein [Hyphomicrobiales bacterium]